MKDDVSRPRDFSCIGDVRRSINEAERHLLEACATMRAAGLTESAQTLMCKVRWLRTWTDPKGYLHWLEQPSEENDDDFDG